jgi:hypothetical protein
VLQATKDDRFIANDAASSGKPAEAGEKAPPQAEAPGPRPAGRPAARSAPHAAPRAEAHK